MNWRNWIVVPTLLVLTACYCYRRLRPFFSSGHFTFLSVMHRNLKGETDVRLRSLAKCPCRLVGCINFEANVAVYYSVSR